MSAPGWTHAIPTEWTLVGLGERVIFAESRAKVRIHDEGAGPFLGVEFSNNEPNPEYSAHEGYFQTHDEIDRFAAHLHMALSAAKKNVANLIEGDFA
jgi:hypothetical protein